MSTGSLIQRHPLATVVVVALVLRLIAVIFSQGYLAHDDHFETVNIAWSWHHEGIFEEDGSLRWEGKPDFGVMRCAAYNLFLLALMKITAVFGAATLGAHMYFDRLIHALLSLLPVLFGYRYLRENTDEKTAFLGGLLLAVHFLMPFLAVRDLVEMVAADLLLPALYFAHRGARNESRRDLIFAAVLGGLALMVRLQVAIALVVVPIAMGAAFRRLKPALIFSIGTMAMIGLMGLLDLWTHGAFLGSVFNYVSGNLGSAPAVPGPWYRYLLLLLGILIPPFSIILLIAAFHRRVIKEHLIWWAPTIVFLVVHSAIVNKQERFILPVLPVLMVLACIGIHHWLHDRGWTTSRPRLLRRSLLALFLINAVFLIPFTFNYGKRGIVSPMVYLSQQTGGDRILIDISERQQFVPYAYWRNDRSGAVVLRTASDLDSLVRNGVLSSSAPPRYAVIVTDDHLNEKLRELERVLGKYEVVYHGQPSLIDALAHTLNPKYNRRNESWVVKLVMGKAEE